MVHGEVAIAFEGIPDQILARKSDVPRLPGMEIPQAANLPSVHQIARPPGGPRRLWHIVADACGEEMPSIVVAIAVVHLDVGAVCHRGTVLANLIQRVRPGITDRTG